MENQNVLRSFITLIAVCVVGLFITIIFAVISQKKLIESQEVRFQSAHLAEELMQSSRDLTRLARTYVVTGQSKYEDEYLKVLDVRNGKKPRPDGKIIAIKTLMENLGFSKEEFAKLQEVEDKSNGLVATETKAMNAVKGLFEDSQGNYIIQKDPDLEMARALMHNDQYHKYIEEIMQPFTEFNNLLDSRTKSTLESFEFWRNLYLAVIAVLIVVIAGLFIAFSRYTMSLIKDLVKKLKSSFENTEKACKKLLATSRELSVSTTEQAAATQSTASSIHEVSAMASNSAKNALSSIKISEVSLEKTSNGKDNVAKMISAIVDIKSGNESIFSSVQESNKNISEITKVINDIAEKTKVINDIVFQTKLLSFNASVEAARAGEYGKGFAVVAEEIGNLAEMSGVAAQEITAMLESSTENVKQIVAQSSSRVSGLLQSSSNQVENGIEVAHQCEDALNDIVQSVNEVSDMIKQITVASSEQERGVTEIKNAMIQIDQVTTKNSESAEDLKSISEVLSSEVENINDVINSLNKIVNTN